MKRRLVFWLFSFILLFLISGDIVFAGYCGSYGCEADETCASCTTDCGLCPPGPTPTLPPGGTSNCSTCSGPYICPSGQTFYTLCCRPVACSGGDCCWAGDSTCFEDPQCNPAGVICTDETQCDDPNPLGTQCGDYSSCQNWDVCGCASSCTKHCNTTTHTCEYTGSCQPGPPFPTPVPINTPTPTTCPPPGTPILTLDGRVASTSYCDRDNIALSWTTVSGATGYDVEYKGATFTYITETAQTSYTHTDTAMADGTYQYRVRASNSCGDGLYSNTVTSYPGCQISNLALANACSAGNPVVNLSWTSTMGTAWPTNLYYLRMGGSAGSYSVDLPTTATSATDSWSIEPMVPYTYQVGCKRSGFMCGLTYGDVSGNITAGSCPTLTPTPTNTPIPTVTPSACASACSVDSVGATDGTFADRVNFSWLVSGGGAGYHLHAGHASPDWWTVQTASDGSTTETGLSCGQSFTYSVKCFRNSDDLQCSEKTDQGSTSACPTSTPIPTVTPGGATNTPTPTSIPIASCPTWVSATDYVCDNTGVTITWNDNSTNELGFRIYRDTGLIYTTGPDVTSYKDTSVSCNSVAHSYQVDAYNTGGQCTGPSDTGLCYLPPTPASPICVRASCQLASAPEAATTCTVDWSNVSGAVSYAVRVDDLANAWSNTCAWTYPDDICVDGLASSIYSFTGKGGHTYNPWFHAVDVCNQWSYGNCPSFCSPAASLTLPSTPPPITIVMGETHPLFTYIVSYYCVPFDRIEFTYDANKLTNVNTADPSISQGVVNVTAGTTPGETTITVKAYLQGFAVPAATGQVIVKIVSPGPWWQTKDGDVHADGTITSLIPIIATVPRYLSLPGDGGMPGVVSYGAGLTLGNYGSASEKDWQAKTIYHDDRVDFDYLMNRLNVDTSKVLPGTGNTRDIPDASGVYYLENSNLQLKGRTIGGSKKIIIFIKGNVTVNRDIEVEKGSFFALITSGDITFSGVPAQMVEKAQGFFLANGSLTVASSGGAADKSFEGEGSFIGWGGVSLSRDLGPGNQKNKTPAEFFLFRPDLLINAPKEFLFTPFVFQEVAP